MRLFMMDSDVAHATDGDEVHALFKVERLDHDYMAVAAVKDASRLDATCLVFVLCDTEGIRCVWRRSVEDGINLKPPAITRVATRFGGDWEHGVTPEDQLDVVDDYERIALGYPGNN